MTADQESRSPLETEPVQKLIVRYAIPTALTLMVNCLYNIVDQIFVGQGVGITAMAAINVAFPVVILVNAVALLLGDGSAANISLCLGRRQQQEADDTHRSRRHPDCRQRSLCGHRQLVLRPPRLPGSSALRTLPGRRLQPISGPLPGACPSS